MMEQNGEKEQKVALWNANYTKAWVSNFMIFFSFMLLTPLLPLYMSEEFGADKDLIGMVLSGYTLTALIIRPFSGYFVDCMRCGGARWYGVFTKMAFRFTVKRQYIV